MDRLVLGMSLLLGAGEVNNRVADQQVIDDCLATLFPKHDWDAACAQEHMGNPQSPLETLEFLQGEYYYSDLRRQVADYLNLISRFNRRWTHAERIWLCSRGQRGEEPAVWKRFNMTCFVHRVGLSIPHLVTLRLEKD